jgi:hypothetical protein
MPALSASQIFQIARSVGFSQNEAIIMVAIALGESGGRTDAIGDTKLQTGKWGPSVGLWQIRSLNAQTGTGGIRDRRANMDPVTNARAAFALFQERKRKRQKGYEDWTVFTKGIYKKHLGTARRAAAGGDPRFEAGGLGGWGSPVGGQWQQAGAGYAYGDLANDIFGEGGAFGDFPTDGGALDAFTAPAFQPLPDEEVRPRIEAAIQRSIGKTDPGLLNAILGEWRASEKRFYDQSVGAGRAAHEGGAGGGVISQVAEPAAFALARTKELRPVETEGFDVGSRVFSDFLNIIGAR